jgi:hypothetical protein
VKKREASELKTKESINDAASVSNNGAVGNAITVTSQNADQSNSIAEKSGTAGSNI